MTRGRTWGLVLLLIALGAGGFVLLGGDGGPSPVAATPRAERPIPLSVATLTLEEQSGFVLRRRFTGRVTARRTSALSFERLGRLASVAVDEGDVVEAGAALASLDRRDLEIEGRRLDAAIRESAARLQELENGPRPTEITAARESVADIAAQIAWSKVREERRRGLVERSAAARESLEQPRFERRSLEARQRGAQARLDELIEGTRAERIAAQRASLDVLVAQRARVALDIEKSQLRAPFAATVMRRHRDEGTVLAAGTPVLELIERDAYEVRIGLPFDAAGEVRTDAEVELRNGDHIVRARLRALAPTLDEATRSRTAILDIEPKDAARVVPGRILRWSLDRNVEQSGFWIPRTALSRSLRGLWSCYAVIEERGATRTERRAVEILHDEDDRVFVRGTLRPEERIVADGVHRIVPGQDIRIEND